MSLIELSGISLSYNGRPAVRELSFSVERGEVFGLLGPNGAGKTTTMLILSGLLEPHAGTIRLDGKKVDPTDRSVRRQLGLVPQDLAVYPDLTAVENLEFFGRLYGLTGRQLAGRAERALESVGLTDRRRDFVGTYSGGMKRRLNFAVSLLHEPKLLILDEPTVGVDPQSRNHLLDCVRALCRSGTTVIYASHYMEEVQAICDRAAIIDQGRLLVSGSLSELLSDVATQVIFDLEHLPETLCGELSEYATIHPGDNGASIVVFDVNGHDQSALQHRLLHVLTILERAGLQIRAVRTRHSDLERLFLELTGRSLRD